MAYERNTNNNNDHSVGIIAISKHQGLWNHQPNTNFVNQPDNPLGLGASRWSRFPLLEQFTGHTAVVSRVSGQVNFARGFVPKIQGYVGAFLGNGGAGTWQDDIHMTCDPTCIGFEIPTSQAEAAQFANWFRLSAPQIDTYSLRGGNASDTFNCVLAAATVMINYLLTLNNSAYEPYIEQLCKIDSSGQGPLMRKMMGGFT